MDTKENNDYLLLKWGTLKGWDFSNSPKAFEALKEYNSLGSSMSAMAQKDTDRQKELICIMIDNVQGHVQNDWTGEVYENKEDAKKYVLEYSKQ
jgi:hypothetical protein